MKHKLNPFQRWMVKSNLQYIPEEGLDVVVNRLRANGYPNIADGVIEAYKVKHAATTSTPDVHCSVP